jgi:hypothetical protein
MQQPLRSYLTTFPQLLIVVPYLLSNPFSIQTGGTTMTSLRQQMTDEMQLRGLSPRTQQSYLNAVRQLAEYYHKPPDQIDAKRNCATYFLYLMNEKQLSPSSCRVAHYAIRFLYVHTLGHSLARADLVVRPQKEIKLPGGAQCGRGATDPRLRAQATLSGLL